MTDDGERDLTQEADVAIVGAGLAGLVAARDLVAAGRSVVVLEARDRVGGRTLNAELPGGGVVDLGAAFVGPTQREVAALARSLGVDTLPTHVDGENVIEWQGRLRRYRGTIPRLGLRPLLDFGQAQLRLERLARSVPLHAPWTAPHAGRLDGQTFWSWVARNLRTRAARTMVEVATESVWSVQPRDVSLLHVLFYLGSAGGLDRLLDTEGGAQQDRLVGGTQRLSLVLADRLGSGRIVLSAPVRRLAHGGDGVVLEAEGGVRVRARRAIVALPPMLAGRIAYSPPLPPLRDGLTQRMPHGSVIKCYAVYDRPFWREAGLTGQGTSDRPPVRATFDASGAGGSPAVLLAFVEAAHARALGALPADERREAVTAGLARLFGPAALRPAAYLECDWTREEFSRGCYGGYFPPGVWTGYGRALREPVGPIHWAGTETASVWNGYMDGAVSSGARVAREVLAADQGSVRA